MPETKIAISLPEGVEIAGPEPWRLSEDTPVENDSLSHEKCRQFVLGRDGQLVRKGTGISVKLLAGYVARFVPQTGHYRAVKHYGAEGKIMQVKVYDDAQALTIAETAKNFKADTTHGE